MNAWWPGIANVVVKRTYMCYKNGLGTSYLRRKAQARAAQVKQRLNTRMDSDVPFSRKDSFSAMVEREWRAGKNWGNNLVHEIGTMGN